MKRSIVLVVLAIAACGPAKRVGRAISSPQRDEFEQERINRAIARNSVVLGMTKGEVRKSWGSPVRSGWTRKFGGKRVLTWSYSFSEVYFDADGIVMGTHAASR